MIAEKKTVCNAVIRGGVRSRKKEVFRKVLLDFVGINFRVCGISIDPGHPGDVFYIGYLSDLSDLQKPPEAAEPPPEYQLRSCKRKQT